MQGIRNLGGRRSGHVLSQKQLQAGHFLSIIRLLVCSFFDALHSMMALYNSNRFAGLLGALLFVPTFPCEIFDSHVSPHHSAIRDKAKKGAWQ